MRSSCGSTFSMSGLLVMRISVHGEVSTGSIAVAHSSDMRRLYIFYNRSEFDLYTHYTHIYIFYKLQTKKYKLDLMLHIFLEKKTL